MNTSTVKDNYQDAAVARAYDRERFKSFVGRTFDRLEKRALRRVVNLTRGEVANPQVLDAPCGTGRITELLLDMGLTVSGGDISPAMIEVAREKCAPFADRTSYRTLDLEAIDYPNNTFDLVTCIRLFHHLDTQARERILRELARVSRRFVMVNVSLSTPYYRFRRRLKGWLGQAVSTTSSTWPEIEREAAVSGLRLVAQRKVLPGISEDTVLLFRKDAVAHE